MAIDYSAYTLVQLNTAYDQSASYVRDMSTAKAGEHVTICQILLRRLPAGAAKGSGSTSFATNLEQIAASLVRAQAWLEAWSDAHRFPDATYADFDERGF